MDTSNGCKTHAVGLYIKKNDVAKVFCPLTRKVYKTYHRTCDIAALGTNPNVVIYRLYRDMWISVPDFGVLLEQTININNINISCYNIECGVSLNHKTYVPNRTRCILRRNPTATLTGPDVKPTLTMNWLSLIHI